MIVVVILATLFSIAVPIYLGAVTRAKNTAAISGVYTIQNEIYKYELREKKLPLVLSDIGRGKTLDPWGHPYQYLNFSTVKGKGKKRKDRVLVPINTSFDLCSMGRDGQSVPPLTSELSLDDIVRANDGTFVGLAWKY